MIREARPVDLDAIEKIYDNIHAAEESGKAKIGWISGITPCVLLPRRLYAAATCSFLRRMGRSLPPR